MRIAVLGDTHDNVGAVKKAIEAVNSSNPDLVMHTGDYISDFMARFFGELRAKMVGVFGESDGDRDALKEAFKKANTEIKGEVYIANLEGTRTILLHGANADITDLARTGCFDLIVYGHTHKIEQRREGMTMIINPGEMCGYLSGKRSFAIIELPRRSTVIKEF